MYTITYIDKRNPASYPCSYIIFIAEDYVLETYTITGTIYLAGSP
nr:MAG TPA: hypothetical protein [Crassvirales sp.]